MRDGTWAMLGKGVCDTAKVIEIASAAPNFNGWLVLEEESETAAADPGRRGQDQPPDHARLRRLRNDDPQEDRRLRVGVLGCGPIAQFAHLESCVKAQQCRSLRDLRCGPRPAGAHGRDL